MNELLTEHTNLVFIPNVGGAFIGSHRVATAACAVSRTPNYAAHVNELPVKRARRAKTAA